MEGSFRLVDDAGDQTSLRYSCSDLFFGLTVIPSMSSRSSLPLATRYQNLGQTRPAEPRTGAARFELFGQCDRVRWVYRNLSSIRCIRGHELRTLFR